MKKADERWDWRTKHLAGHSSLCPIDERNPASLLKCNPESGGKASEILFLYQPDQTQAIRMSVARFMVRVELRDGLLSAAEADLALLEGAMVSAGFSMWMRASRGATYRLPIGEYYIAGAYTRLDVLEKAKRAATAPGRDCAILVTEGVGFLWNGLEPVPEGENREG